ncbi:DNA-nicking endonuclease, Smr domain [Limimonas halophila]|uniref:DNA-nicking endonuclease, Smr domain n=1 Tax=Limimonas halophila TaxID=1082479 RepID=A0A1G7SL97_9PROT|nr:Smr/MutS family protein [Limimonas halophila]SDG23826.1 DNA-nicking endonuclease, Smr domain [Limimonas halophila]
MADTRDRAKGGRRPTSAEQELWREMMRDVTPLHRDDTLQVGETTAPAEPGQDDSIAERQQSPSPAGPPSRKQARKQAAAAAAKPEPAPVRVGSVAGIDRRTAERLRRGRIPIEASIDLHGMTRQAAGDALLGFLNRAADRGQRCVLVITGKGRATGESVLRNEVPRWLNHAAVRPHVLACVPAQQRDGGAGAFYVLLRRRRA